MNRSHTVRVWAKYSRDNYKLTTIFDGVDSVELVTRYGEQSYSIDGLIAEVTRSATRLVKLAIADRDLYPGVEWSGSYHSVVSQTVTCSCPYASGVFVCEVTVSYF